MSHEPETLDPLLMDVITHMGGTTMNQILKGHMLIERELWDLLKLHSRDPDRLPDMSFYLLMKLARALTHREGDGPMWDAIEVVNQVRNKFAHDLEPPEVVLERKLADLCRAYPGIDKIARARPGGPGERLASCVAFLLGVVRDFGELCERER